MRRRRSRFLASGALLAPLLLALSVPARAADEGPPYGTAAIVFVVPGVSFEQLLAVPEIRALATAGGAALLANPDRFAVPRVPAVPAGVSVTPRVQYVTLDPTGPGGLGAVGSEIERRTTSFPSERVLVVVLSAEPSPQMREARDELPPIVMAEGAPGALFPSNGVPHSLTSDSTRRDGVVDGGDVQTTIIDHLHRGSPPPVGSPIRIVGAPAPFGLHERYLAMRRMVVPIETGAGLYVTLAGVLAVALLAFGRGPQRLRRAAAMAALSPAALVVGLLAAGHLPTLSYATVVPFVVAVTVVGTLAFWPLGRLDPLLVPVGIGTGVLAFFAVEAVLGWTAALTTFHGGSELDGGRFYGLPNAFIGLLIGAAVYVASRLRTWPGFALIAGVGVFAGFPSLGANLGGAASLFAAAGIWLGVRERRRLGPWKAIAVAAATVILGTLVVLVANRLSPSPTHITRFEESSGIARAWSTFVDRLGVGWQLLERNPFGLIPVVGLFVCLWVALRPPGAVRDGFAAAPVWRDAVVTISVAGIVAYVANDSGAAACGMAFALGLGGLMYVSLTAAAAKMEPT